MGNPEYLMPSPLDSKEMSLVLLDQHVLVEGLGRAIGSDNQMEVTFRRQALFPFSLWF